MFRRIREQNLKPTGNKVKVILRVTSLRNKNQLNNGMEVKTPVDKLGDGGWVSLVGLVVLVGIIAL